MTRKTKELIKSIREIINRIGKVVLIIIGIYFLLVAAFITAFLFLGIIEINKPDIREVYEIINVKKNAAISAKDPCICGELPSIMHYDSNPGSAFNEHVINIIYPKRICLKAYREATKDGNECQLFKYFYEEGIDTCSTCIEEACAN